MKTIYTIVSAPTKQELVRRVNVYLVHGCKCQGGVVIAVDGDFIEYLQAVTKEVDDKTTVAFRNG
jgi:hypothetical protein